MVTPKTADPTVNSRREEVAVLFSPALLTWQHVIKAGLGLRVAQQRLGSEDDQLVWVGGTKGEEE